MEILKLSIEIPDKNVIDTKEALLAIWPNIEINEEGNPLYIDEEWLLLHVKDWLQEVYLNGKKKIRDRNAVIIDDIFE